LSESCYFFNNLKTQEFSLMISTVLNHCIAFVKETSDRGGISKVFLHNFTFISVSIRCVNKHSADLFLNLLGKKSFENDFLCINLQFVYQEYRIF